MCVCVFGVLVACCDFHHQYAGALIIWDRMFGTFQEEEEEPVYGLVSPIQSFDPTHVQFGYLQEIIGKACSLPTWRQRWRALFASPAVNPTDGSLYEIPEVCLSLLPQRGTCCSSSHLQRAGLGG